MSGGEEVVVPAKNLRLSLIMLSHSSIQVIKYQAESSARHRQLMALEPLFRRSFERSI